MCSYVVVKLTFKWGRGNESGVVWEKIEYSTRSFSFLSSCEGERLGISINDT